MTIATDQQVQNFSDAVWRPLCEQWRAVIANTQDAIAACSEVYSNLAQGSPTWTDGRTDSPPNLLTVANLLAINAFLNNMKTAALADSGWPVIQEGCVRPLNAR